MCKVIDRFCIGANAECYSAGVSVSINLPTSKAFLSQVQGRRFFLSNERLPAKASSQKALPQLLHSELPLTIEAPKRHRILQKATPALSGPEAVEMAQLMRIWVVTPEEPLQFALHPRLVVEVRT